MIIIHIVKMYTSILQLHFFVNNLIQITIIQKKKKNFSNNCDRNLKFIPKWSVGQINILFSYV